ncbi:MAG: catalase [Lachnospiraceae bacterium]|nr:catalase [Lachnospiraceae bacterium]
MYILNAWRHFGTITRHRWLVREHCFKMGLFWQGLTHDLSKYSPAEFWPGVKYYKGNESPHNGERKETGQSKAWLHHKGRNKHHLEYWIDYNLDKKDRKHPLCGTPMPVQYVAEMLADRMAACKVYQGEKYTRESPWIYYQKGRAHYLMHERTRRQLEFMLKMLAKKGEEETFSFIRKRILYNDDAPLTKWYFRYFRK